MIEVEQLLQRGREVFISSEPRDERAEGEHALDHIITADQKEQEWCEISDQIVKEFNEEFAIIDLEPNVVNFTQALRDVRKLVNGGVIGANFGPCGDRLGDTVREPTNFAHPFAAEATNYPLHLGNQITLQRIERDSGR